MNEHAGVFPEALPMVAGDDHPGSLENRPPFELIEELAQSLVEIGEAIVVCVASEADLPLGRLVFLDLNPIAKDGPSSLTRSDGAEPMNSHRRKVIRIMSVIEIQEREERPIRLMAPGKPGQELLIDHACVFSAVPEESPDEIGRRPQERDARREGADRFDPLNPIHDTTGDRGQVQDRQPGEDEVAIRGEAASQP